MLKTTTILTAATAGHFLILSLSFPAIARGMPTNVPTPEKKISETPKPNFIIIFCDDMGYSDIGCFGSDKNRTPNIDRMAQEGMRFKSFYVTSGVCSPSRSSLMTGCYPMRVGMHENSKGFFVLFPQDQKGLNPKEITIAEILKQQGYATACIGKWHLGDQPEFLPRQQGFDYYYGLPYSNDMQENPPLPLMRNETVIEAPAVQETLTQRYTNETVKFIHENKDKPFFIYLPHTMPHVPWHASSDFKGKSANGIYGDVIEEIDYSTGKILEALKESGVDDNTLIVFTSDNGGIRRNNIPLSGGKATIMEGGMRVPCVMRWPASIPAGTSCDEVCTTMDLLPTFARLAGTSEPDDRIIDGKNILNLMQHKNWARSPHKAFYYYFMSQLRAVRSGPWKLHLGLDPMLEKWSGDPTGKCDAVLYNLESDIAEKKNVIEEHPRVVKKLMKLAEKARHDIGDYKLQGSGCRASGWVENPVPLVMTGFTFNRSIKGIQTSDKTGAAPAVKNSSPNVIIILADDLGCGDMSLYNGWIKTPRIDQMAKEGVRFTDFHSNSSVCSPTRAALLTGRYQQRVGIVDVIAEHLDTPGLEPTELTIPRLMKQNGYSTALFGKWHLGGEVRQNPIYHGFDEFVGFLPGGCDYHKHDNWMEGTKVKMPEGYSTDIITDRSIDFIKRNKQNPFFLYVSHQAVHNPYQTPDGGIKTKVGDIEKNRPRYMVMLKELDKGVGRILDTLKELGLDENTFVFFFSDNGAVNMNPNERPYRGGKFSNYEGGHRVPAVARWPNHIKAGWTSNELIVGMDLLPTITDIVGIDIPRQRKLDGISIKDHLLNQADLPDRQVFFGYEPKLGTAMRDGHWKLQTRDNVIELYDLSRDIKETTNIADKYPKRTEKMKAAIEKWKIEVTTQLKENGSINNGNEK